MKFLNLALLGCLSSTATFASNIAPCTEQTLAQYMGAPNCSIGNLVFGELSYTPTSLGTGVAPSAADIMVTPIDQPGDYGLEFSANWVGEDAGGSDVAIGYFVASGSGAADLGAASLGMVGSASGDSNAILDEYICPGEEFSSTCANQVHLHESIGPTGPSGTGPQVPYASFDPVSSMQLVKDLRVYGVTGTSSVSEISNQYPMPEPLTPLLCFSGLVGVWAFRKYRSRSNF
jgi:hypothetical protein